MTRYSPTPGDVVLVAFPFTNPVSEKKRPALIVSPATYSSRYHDVVILALTSQPQSDDDLKLSHWQEAGLKSPTWIKPLITTLELTLIERRLGVLMPSDQPGVLRALNTLVDFHTEKWQRRVA